ncbi:hypothetical protein QVD17_03858 [Tagetes erecta]|uniref:Uncharacterized protein n=1 Tax=Tagetes erecta TaxID=13708 RepID=A0AAD8LIF4_TARER|nr:hypothetical protein QVD17_03858 [Tagetes erecta]
MYIKNLFTSIVLCYRGLGARKREETFIFRFFPSHVMIQISLLTILRVFLGLISYLYSHSFTSCNPNIFGSQCMLDNYNDVPPPTANHVGRPSA